MNSNYFYAEYDWRAQAKALFFMDHMRITDIAQVVNKARETVSRFIRGCEGYENEMAFRREACKEQRREYQRNWDREHRQSCMKITAESLKQEHEAAVRILSAEKY